MKKSKFSLLSTLIAVFVVLALVLSACGPAAEETPAAEEPTTEEVEEVEEAEEAEEPAAEEEVAEEPASPEEAEEAPAEEGVSVWDTGFRVTFGYNEGNDVRRVVAEILRDNLAAVNPNFVVEVQALPWPNYLEASRAHQLPFGTTGWLEDYHDPHNWYQPYLVGYYAQSYGFTPEMVDAYNEYLDAGLEAIGDFDARSEVYSALNQKLYEDATFIPGYMPEGRHYEQNWVEGYYYNPLYSQFYYYELSKTDDAPDPTTMYVGSIGEPDTLDPAIDYETGGGEINQNVYETLVFFDHTKGNEFVPMLATDWEVSDDGMTYVFNIRDGVKFHEGGDLTAEDVAWSFQRGMLNGYAWSPQWMIMTPMFGVDDISELVNAQDENVPAFGTREEMQAGDPDVLMSVCESVKASVVADNEAGTVTFNLTKKAPFVPALAHQVGSVMDKEWAIEMGAWDGDCATWQDYYMTTEEDSPFYNVTNGTGPFKLLSWDKATKELTLVRNDNYWRTEEVGPAWEGGRTGNAALERVVIKNIEEWGTRLQMFLNGDLDMNYVPRQYVSQVDPYVNELLMFDIETGGFNPTDEMLPGMNSDPNANLTLFKGAVGANRVEIYFNYAISNAENSNTFIGSGKLDGDGIPVDFFNNVHVRRAFSYCYDSDLFIEEVLQGEGARPTGGALPGMEGYSWDDPVYEYDLDKCAEEFQKAIFPVE
ncbi:MAG: hypothetical protein JW750_03735 [Anaerolineaceae bacterium]|nr:hypothetical protein [Anaerolineaceae bacterium]